MNECTVSLAGCAITEVSRHTTANGRTLARFRMVVPERRFDRATDRYIDRDPSYFTVIAWGHIAENVLAGISRGDSIVVAGQLRVREWRTADGVARTTTEVTANSIGIDLAVRGRAGVTLVAGEQSARPQHERTDAA